MEALRKLNPAEFHVAFAQQTQQAFLEGLSLAFGHFGGVFERVRFDNLGSAVKKVLKGRSREETDRFVALRSHYLFESEFCRVGLAGAHEKGGVEGAAGRFRRNHLTPVPQAALGSEVVLWGRSASGAVLTIDEVARTAGTIGYELMCAVAPRVPFAVDAG